MTAPNQSQTPNFPTPEEIAEMEKNFGNLPTWAKQVTKATKEEGADPLKHSDVDFEGFTHKPIAYTFDFGQKVFWMQRYLFLDDIQYLSDAKIPVRDYMMVTFADEKILRVNFAYEADENGIEEDEVFAQIVSLTHDVEEQNGRACVELMIPIASVEVIEGIVISEENSDNAR